MTGNNWCEQNAQPTKPAETVGSFVQFVLAMWSSLQQKYEAVFKPLKPLISKELAFFCLTGLCSVKGCSGGVHGVQPVVNTGVFKGCSGGCSPSGVFTLSKFIFRYS